MSVRNIIEIDEALCDGCGECVPSCAEGALQIIDGKARLVSDVLCDGLGACLGECPTGALTVTQRDAPQFDEAAVEAHLGKPAPARPHAAPTAARPHASPMAAQPSPMAAPISQATTMAAMAHDGGGHHGCPGSAVRVFPLIDKTPVAAPPPFAASATGSKLRQWPVQLHLTPPTAPFFQDRDVLRRPPAHGRAGAGIGDAQDPDSPRQGRHSRRHHPRHAGLGAGAGTAAICGHP